VLPLKWLRAQPCLAVRSLARARYHVGRVAGPRTNCAGPSSHDLARDPAAIGPPPRPDQLNGENSRPAFVSPTGCLLRANQLAPSPSGSQPLPAEAATTHRPFRNWPIAHSVHGLAIAPLPVSENSRALTSCSQVPGPKPLPSLGKLPSRGTTVLIRRAMAHAKCAAASAQVVRGGPNQAVAIDDAENDRCRGIADRSPERVTSASRPQEHGTVTPASVPPYRAQSDPTSRPAAGAPRWIFPARRYAWQQPRSASDALCEMPGIDAGRPRVLEDPCPCPPLPRGPGPCTYFRTSIWNAFG